MQSVMRVSKGVLTIQTTWLMRNVDKFFKLRCLPDMMNVKGFKVDSVRASQLYAAYDLLAKAFAMGGMQNPNMVLYTNNFSAKVFFEHMTKWKVHLGAPEAQGENVLLVTFNTNLTRNRKKHNVHTIHISPQVGQNTRIDGDTYYDQGIIGPNQLVIENFLS